MDDTAPDRVRRADGGRPAAVTITQVAREAGVSVATVSRTLAGNYPVAEGTRTRVLDTVRRLGYVPNAHARALIQSATRQIGIVINDVADPFFGYIARGVERQASAAGRICLIMASDGDKRRELEAVDLLREQRAEAIILVGGASDDSQYRRQMARRARALHDSGARLVLCGRPSLGDDVPTRNVTYDNEGGAFAITDYVISQGHRRILLIGGPTQLSTTTARMAGFHRALQTRGITPDPDLEHIGRFGKPFGYATMRRLLDGPRDFTAVFGANDLVAAGIRSALEEAGVDVPQEISLVGYDDIPVAQELRPRLTTVYVPLEEMGREAVRSGLATEDPLEPSPPEDVVVGTHVVIRDSVAALNSDQSKETDGITRQRQ